MPILSVFPLPGISYTHDANACLVERGRILYAAEEERFLRSQHAIAHVPERAALIGLRHASVHQDAIERLVVVSMEHCRKRNDFHSRTDFIRELFLIPKTTPVSCVSHHVAHSALAVLTSPYKDCLFITFDGGGDGGMGHCGVFRDGRFRILERFDISPAILFGFLTTLCGYPLFEEGKVMGLAAYGRADPDLRQWLHRHFWIKENGAALQTDLTLVWQSTLALDRVDPDSFARHKYYRLGVAFAPEQDERWIAEIAPMDIARTAQEFFQEIVVTTIRNLVRRTGLNSVACSGGAFLNAAANGYAARVLQGIDIYVPMAPHDAGLSLGGALWADYHLHGTRPTHPVSPYLGPAFSGESVSSALRPYIKRSRRPENIESAVAEAIANGKIVGWFHGRAEYGARALGARSVLADPRNLAAKARLNQLMKRRDWFMPFAPSVLEEFGEEYFEDFRSSPYMNMTFRIRNEKRSAIGGAVHVDGTCRVHTVSQKLNPQFHYLIAQFQKITGVPFVLNTSFNRHGVPMVCTPKDALDHLSQGCVDLLAIEGHLVEGNPSKDDGVAMPDGALADFELMRHVASLARLGKHERAREILQLRGMAITVTDRDLVDVNAGRWSYQSSFEELQFWCLVRHKSGEAWRPNRQNIFHVGAP